MMDTGTRWQAKDRTQNKEEHHVRTTSRHKPTHTTLSVTQTPTHPSPPSVRPGSGV